MKQLKNRYKVLPLPDIFKYKSKTIIKKILKDIKDMEGKKINPVFESYNWYYDRYNNISWIETPYGCFQDKNTDMFLYYLKIYNHRRLTKKEFQAIETLFSYGLKNKELTEIHNIEKTLKAHQRIKSESNRIIKKLLR